LAGKGATVPFALLLLTALTLILLPQGEIETIFLHTDYNQQRFTEVAFLLALLAGFLALPGLRRGTSSVIETLPTPARWGLGLFFLLGLLSALTSPNRLASLTDWGLLASLFLGTVILAYARIRTGRMGELLLLLGLFAAVTLYAGDFLAFYTWSLVPFEWSSPFFHFGNVRFLNQFQTWTLPLLTVATLWPKARTLRITMGLVVALWWAILFATAGRGSLIALTLATLVTFLFLSRTSREWLKAWAIWALAGLGMYFLVFSDGPGLGNALEESTSGTDQARWDLWNHALELAVTHPWLGVGPLHYSSSNPPGGISHPHNALLQLTSEWGVLATILGSSLVAWALWAWLRFWRTTRSRGTNPSGLSSTVAGLTCSLLAGMAHSMVSGIMVMPVSQVTAVAVVGLAIGIFFGKIDRPSTVAQPKGGTWAPLVGLAVLAASSLCWLLLSTMSDLRQSEKLYLQTHEQLHPRIWRQGAISSPPWRPFPSDKAEDAKPGDGEE
jgi:hypothetical protein